jgi:hypothetical protein
VQIGATDRRRGDLYNGVLRVQDLRVGDLVHPPEAVEDDRVQQMFVTFERRQTLSIEVALGVGTGGEECEYVIHLSYSEPLAGELWDAANPAVEVLPASPRPEPFALWNQQISTSYRPNDYGNEGPPAGLL